MISEVCKPSRLDQFITFYTAEEEEEKFFCWVFDECRILHTSSFSFPFLDGDVMCMTTTTKSFMSKLIFWETY